MLLLYLMVSREHTEGNFVGEPSKSMTGGRTLTRTQTFS